MNTYWQEEGRDQENDSKVFHGQGIVHELRFGVLVYWCTSYSLLVNQ